MNKGEKISRIIAFTLYDFFVTTNRDNGGRNYKLLEKTLSRLKRTVIKTNVVYSENKQETIYFGLINIWRIIEDKKEN